MRKLLIAALMLVSATCQKEATEKTISPIEERSATVYGDQLPVDGCGAHLLLNVDGAIADPRPFRRLPSEATRPLMDNLIKAEIAKQPAGTLWMGSKDVIIRYRDTGQTATLTCGWGNRQELKTIELLDIKAR
jgi:hypothetical protein